MCVNGLQAVYYDLLMRWWSSKLSQGLLQRETPSLFSCALFTFPSLPPSSGTYLTPTPTLPSTPCPLFTQHQTTLPHSAPHCPPLPPGSSVYLDVSRFPLYGAYSSQFLGVSSGVPCLCRGCISLSTPLIPPRSSWIDLVNP